jgi:hypothetical protein
MKAFNFHDFFLNYPIYWRTLYLLTVSLALSSHPHCVNKKRVHITYQIMELLFYWHDMNLIQFPKMPYGVLNFIRTSCNDTGLKVGVCQGGIWRGEGSLSIRQNVKISLHNFNSIITTKKLIEKLLSVYFYVKYIYLFSIEFGIILFSFNEKIILGSERLIRYRRDMMRFLNWYKLIRPTSFQ